MSNAKRREYKRQGAGPRRSDKQLPRSLQTETVRKGADEEAGCCSQREEKEKRVMRVSWKSTGGIIQVMWA